MKQTLALRMGTQLSMTPQLQQAIRLMQLSAVELNLEIRQAIESNPMLELVEDDGADAVDGDEMAAEEPVDEVGSEDDGATESPDEESDYPDAADDPLADTAEEWDDLEAEADEVGSQAPDDAPQDIPDDLPVDVSWDDVYQPATPTDAGLAGGAADDDGFEERNGTGESLTGHLLWQLNLTSMSDRDRLAALAVIDSIDDDGMLRASIDDLLDALDPTLAYEADEMEAVLRRVQSFDPAGVGARDLPECLLRQLEQMPSDVPWRDQALSLVRDHFPTLANRDFATLARRAKLGADELVAVIALIQSLNPRPGATIGDAATEYVEPDVIVTKRRGRWTVDLNRENTPKVRVNGLYAGFIKPADSSADNQFLKDNLQEARWFLKNLEYRNETLLRVAGEIVKRQRGFLEHGEEAMQPLILADIAGAVDRHESTISRVTTRKYMDTPRGIFELKYFFSSHVNTANGGEVSSTAIRAVIRKLTAEEDPKKPLSDAKIADILREREIKVARRTVAKYRESLAIPPSNERRRLL
ncbi:MAG: RNA polymerase factor sigma-54 [Gammaproteobacteria bacterium]|nr:RNA polymerase factor sigma-54 [Gammaproteobacteria bacterium]